MPLFRFSEAAALLAVSDDTLRRWADAGRLVTTVDRSGRRAIEGTVLARFAQDRANEVDRPKGGRGGAAASTRNRFTGLVTNVIRDTVMAQVEIQAGPNRIVALMSREAADALGLEPGVLAVASVKATQVTVEVPPPPSRAEASGEARLGRRPPPTPSRH